MAWTRLTSCSDEGAELPKGCSAVGHALRVIEGISAARGVESAGGAVPEGRSEPTAQAGFRLTCSPRSSIGPSPPRRSSNRTCGFLASGSRTDFTRRHSTQEAPKLNYAEVTVHLDVPEPRCLTGQLVPPSQEVPRTRRDVYVHEAERRIGGVVGEVGRPAREVLVELTTDVLPALRTASPEDFAHPLSDLLHCLLRRSGSQIAGSRRS